MVGNLPILKSYLYRLEMNTFPNNTNNNCFCSTDFYLKPPFVKPVEANEYEQESICDGQFDLQQCNYFLPFTLSRPHNMYASRRNDRILGLNPIFKEHESFIEIDSLLGLTLKSQLSFQLNAKVGIEGKTMYVPYVWFKEVLFDLKT